MERFNFTWSFRAALGFWLGVVQPLAVAEPLAQPLKLQAATASSVYNGFTAAQAIDGTISADSRWTSAQDKDPAWLEVDLGGTHALAGIHLYTGISPTTAVTGFKLHFRRDGQWVDIPSAVVTNNHAAALSLAFDDTVAVTTDRLRLWITATPDGYARIKEFVVWPASVRQLPPLATAVETLAEKVPLIYLNQSGFNLGKPKRFTAPTLPDGTPFDVRPASGGGKALFAGKIMGHIGDFSAFNPADDAREFVVVAGPHTSVPFRVGQWWLERVTYQNAVNFMIDSRHYVGNSRPVCRGSFGWRDDHSFGWELHTLVPQFLANPSAYTRMPSQITYEAPADPKLWGALEPYRADIPDLVKLIHWGADVIVTQRLGHEHLKAQLAYFLYAWPWLKAYLPEQNYTVVRDYAFAAWTTPQADRLYPYDESPEHNLLALKTQLGSTKGCYPPGFSIEPNLLLYHVALREFRKDAEHYFQAAHRQAEWLVANLDWNDPQTTKGQRMSEWITVNGLAHFLREYPNRAPSGLAAKLAAWAQVAVRRSANLWDFRKLDDADRWAPTGDKPTMWNEPGNVVGLPVALLAARPFVRDATIRDRLEELVYAHLDNSFGRNPTGRHFSYDAPREIEGVEQGWYSFYKGGIGQLEKARFVIDGSPKQQHYPYHPELGDIGWTEGWVQFNTAFNHTLTMLAFSESSLAARVVGDELVVQLTAPLNFDYDRVETAELVVTLITGATVKLTVTEDSPNARTFSGRMQRPKEAITEVSYGFGYLAHRAKLTP